MGLLDLAVASTLGGRRAPDRLDLALFYGAKEVSDPAYRRHTVVKGGWSVVNGQASFPARFGPFSQSTTFDRAVLMRGDETIESVPMLGVQTIAPGSIYDHEFVAVWAKQPVNP